MTILRMVMLAMPLLSIAHALLIQKAHALTFQNIEPPVKQNSKCNIFAYWDYPDAIFPYLRLNVEAWRRHSQGRCNEPILINDANVKEYIPDMPDEFFEVYPAAKSDLIRYSVLYHHGGIYMDTDVLVVKDMSPFVDALENHDLVSYMMQDYPQSGNTTERCGRFASNIMGARKGSSVMQGIWEGQKKLLRKRCVSDAQGKTLNPEMVPCCYDPANFSKAQLKHLDFRRCHIPWGSLINGLQEEIISRNPEGIDKSFCFQNENTFVPYNFHMKRTLHAAVDSWKADGTPNPLGRMMYHMFNQLWALQTFNCKQLLDATTLVGHLYTKSFYGSKPVPSSDASKMFFSKHRELQDLGCEVVSGSGEVGVPGHMMVQAAASHETLTKTTALRQQGHEPDQAEVASWTKFIGIAEQLHGGV